VNEVCGHFSPLKGESRLLREGDVAKISLSCHIDGFIAEAAHTVLVGEATAEDTRADVIHAAWHGAEAALRTLVVGGTNAQVTEVLGKVAAEYGCKPLQGVLSHQLKKHVIDGNRVIIGAETPEMQVDEIEFEMNEVYSIDIVMSTGEGKGRESETRTTVYKRQVENSYQLKTAKARQFISEVNRRFPVLPFTLRAIEEETTARVGITEAKRHELVEEYPVLRERDGVFVAQFKFTALLLPGGTKRITGLPFGTLETRAATTRSVEDEELKKLLASSANPKKQKKKKAAAPKAGADAPADEPEKA
jgi:curved DNA binding protein